MEPQCTFSIETCSCRHCLELNLAFTQAEWYLRLQQSRIQEALLHNGETLSHEHICSLRLLQRQSMIDVEKIDAEIQRTQNLLEKLKNHKERVKKAADQYALLLAPVRHLPTEILRHIFFFATPSIESCARLPDDRSISVRLENGPWAVSGTCRLWRDIVLDAPELWAQWAVRFAINSYGTVLHCVERMEEGFRRAGEHGLRISLIQEENEQMFQGATKSFLVLNHHLMRKFSSRFVDLDIQCLTSEQLRLILLGIDRDHFPALRRFTLTMGRWLSDVVKWMFMLLEGSTDLTEINLYRTETDYTSCLLSHPFRWSRLKRFRSNHCQHYQDVCNVLRQSSNLTLLKIGPPVRTSSGLPRSVMRHSKLLELYTSENWFLKYVDLPSLQSLVIGDGEDFTSSVGSRGFINIQDFISRSGCNLTTLEIMHVKLPLPLDLLSLLGSLTKLFLGTCEAVVNEQFLQLLTSSYLELPALRHLALHLWKGPHSTWTMAECVTHLYDFLRSRQHGNMLLTSFKFGHPIIAFSGNEASELDKQLNTHFVPFRVELMHWLDQGLRISFREGTLIRKDPETEQFRFFSLA